MRKQKNIQLKRCAPEIDLGLNFNEVEERKKFKLTNKIKNKNTKSYTTIIFQNTFTFFNLIWALIFVALVFVRSYTDLLFALVIVANTLIAIIQECKAKHTVEKLKLVNAPKITCIRDGKSIEISSNDIVLDDIIILSSGNQVPADLIILDGSVEVNESLLTGESVPIKKTINNSILAGSFLTSGKCVCRVDKVGNDVYIQSIAKVAKTVNKPHSDLFKDLNKLIKAIGIFLIPMGALMFVNNFYGQKAGLTVAVTKTCGSLTGMIPAGMFLLVTIALAVGVIKLSKKHTLIQDLYSIEMLARTNVLCLDKTGTLTDGTMEVKTIQIVDKDIQLEEIENIIANINSCQPTTNATSKALEVYKINTQLKSLKNLPFSSERKQTITMFENLDSYFLGAPEYINCKQTKALKTKISNFAKAGYRVLVLSKSQNVSPEELNVKTESQPIALIVIEDHVRPDAPQTIAWFKENGVKIKIISGDNPETVSNIAQRVGVENAEKCISLENMSLEEVAQIADKYTIFGRVTPEQKHTLIKTLKSLGNTVAMTGDGVNDTLALKEADCSIAMADGSEVARNISSIVLMNSSFASLPSVVQEGRQVVNNIQRSSSLFLMKTIFTILLSIISVVSLSLYPYAPAQLFMLECFVIGVPSVFLALQPNKDLIKGHFLQITLKTSFPYALLLFVNIAVVLILHENNILSLDEFNTLSTLTLTICGFLCLVKQCLPFTKLRAICLFTSLTAIIIGTFALPKLFKLGAFTKMVWLPLGLLACFTLLILAIWAIIENSNKQKYKRAGLM